MSGKIDQIIDNFAFGKAKPPSGPCLGLYLSPDVVYISETRLGKNGAFTVDHLVRIPIPPDGKSAAGTLTMNTDFLSDPLKVGALIRQSMAQIRWNSKNVVVTLSHHLGLLRYFPMPPMDRRFHSTAVPIEAKKYIPIPFDALTHDYQVEQMPPDTAGKPRLGVLIAVTQNKNLSNINALLTSLGLNLIGLEVAPCSALRLWQAVEPAKENAPFVQVHFDGGNVRIMICDRGLPVFFREVFLGAEASLSDQRKLDMTGCLSFAKKQLGLGGISRIVISGTSAALEPWKEAFNKETTLPTAVQDTAKLLSIKGGDWGGFAAIGASMRPSSASALTLDLSTKDRVSEDERRVAKDIILAGVVVAALVGGVGVFQATTYKQRAKELNKYKVDPEVAGVLQGLSSADISAQIVEMKEQLTHLRSITGGKQQPLSTILREIVALMPDNMWLLDFNALNPLSSEQGTLTLTLHGRIHGESVGEEQATAFQFKESILKDAHLGPLFDVQISVKGRAGPSATTALDPAALARTLEDRTDVVVELKGKH